ncbi:MAG: DUF4180 domain-containing protein [Spirochaetaceae bacterium]|jgi:hypothetical protein|nr:DUF4180 domain-containing protein [Spirochaetaceae bacterium]
MRTVVHEYNGIQVIEFLPPPEDALQKGEFLVQDESDFLDVMTICPGRRVILRKEHILGDFFDLKTGLAGRILQKVSTYGYYLGILGDFEQVESKSLRDFIYESNRTGQVMFKKTVPEILEVFYDN